MYLLEAIKKRKNDNFIPLDLQLIILVKFQLNQLRVESFIQKIFINSQSIIQKQSLIIKFSLSFSVSV